MNRTLFTLHDFKVDLLADTTYPARLKFRSLAALVVTELALSLAAATVISSGGSTEGSGQDPPPLVEILHF